MGNMNKKQTYVIKGLLLLLLDDKFSLLGFLDNI